MSPLSQYWLYFLKCFCPTSPGGICILFISNSKQLSGLIRPCKIWFLPTSPPCLRPLSAPPNRPVTLPFRLFPRSWDSFLVLGLCSCSYSFLECPPTPPPDLSILAPSGHSHFCSNVKVVFIPQYSFFNTMFSPLCSTLQQAIVNSILRSALWRHNCLQ